MVMTKWVMEWLSKIAITGCPCVAIWEVLFLFLFSLLGVGVLDVALSLGHPIIRYLHLADIPLDNRLCSSSVAFRKPMVGPRIPHTKRLYYNIEETNSTTLCNGLVGYKGG